MRAFVAGRQIPLNLNYPKYENGFMNRRKIGRFIYYFSGVAFPFLIGPFFVFACQFPKQDYAVLSYSLVVLVAHILVGKIARNKKFIQKTNFLSFDSLFPLIGAFLFWIYQITTIYGQSIRCPDYSSSVKSKLMNGIKECVVRSSDNKTTKFEDVPSFLDKNSNYNFPDGRFKIEPLDFDSCYGARAVPESDLQTWFELKMDINTGKLSRTCGDSSKQGCEEGNTW